MSISFVQVQNELKLCSFAFKELYSLINKTHLALYVSLCLFMFVDGAFNAAVNSVPGFLYCSDLPCPNASPSPLCSNMCCPHVPGSCWLTGHSFFTTVKKPEHFS